jgi:hypothetical protein
MSYTYSMLPVFMLFLIPVGGGIPAGVLLARSHGLSWPFTAFLYFVSDLVLALCFEPFLRLMAMAGRRFPRLGKAAEAMRQSTLKTAANIGLGAGPFTLVMIAFGVDPMTGRTAAMAAGHGFIGGWAIAITGDMMYYALIAACTLRLSAYMTPDHATAAVLVGMLVVPWLIKKVKTTLSKKAPAAALPPSTSAAD